MKSKQILLAAVQDSPVSFDLQASLDKVENLTKEAAEKARGLVKDQDSPVVVVFPEAFLSAYPRGYDVGIHPNSLFKNTVDGSSRQEKARTGKPFHDFHRSLAHSFISFSVSP